MADFLGTGNYTTIIRDRSLEAKNTVWFILALFDSLLSILFRKNTSMLRSRKHVFGLFYGLTAGLVFASAAWGVNAFILSRAHFAYPWITFLAGILPVLLITGLAGFISVAIQNAIAATVIWLVAGVLVGAWGVWLPLKLVPEILVRLEPVLNGWVTFGWEDAHAILLVSAAFYTGIAFLIAGIIGMVMLEQAAWSTYSGAILAPLLVCALIAGIIGGVVDNFANARYRNSISGLDRLFTFALENQGKQVDKSLARSMHMNAVSLIATDLSEQRRLFYFSFDTTAEQGRILVDLNGHWAICDVFLDSPAFCQPSEPPQS